MLGGWQLSAPIYCLVLFSRSCRPTSAPVDIGTVLYIHADLGRGGRSLIERFDASAWRWPNLPQDTGQLGMIPAEPSLLHLDPEARSKAGPLYPHVKDTNDGERSLCSMGLSRRLEKIPPPHGLGRPGCDPCPSYSMQHKYIWRSLNSHIKIRQARFGSCSTYPLSWALCDQKVTGRINLQQPRRPRSRRQRGHKERAIANRGRPGRALRRAGSMAASPPSRPSAVPQLGLWTAAGVWKCSLPCGRLAGCDENNISTATVVARAMAVYKEVYGNIT